MFSTPLGFLALLAVPAIVALHLFRRRFQPRVVSALFLWGAPDPTPMSGRKRERLRVSGSLLCEIAAALCVAFFLAGPRGCAGESARHLVFVLDGSASMGARTPQGTTLVEVARKEIEKRIDALSGGSRVTIVASAARPKVLAGPAAIPREARESLAAFEPSAVSHDLLGAVALGLQLSGGGSVVLVTDRFTPESFPPEVEIVAVGQQLDNVAIVRASRSADDDRTQDHISITLASFARTRRDVHVDGVLPLERDRAVLQPESVTLEPGERRTLGFEVPRETGPIEVRLDADALGIDDRALLAPEPRRTVSLRTNVSEEMARTLGLSVSGGSRIGRWLELAHDVVEAHDDATAHVLLTDHEGGGPTTWTLRLATLGKERRDFIGPFLADKRHPLLEGTTLEGIVWSADPTLVIDGAPIIAAGNLPLLLEDRAGTQRAYVLDIDPVRSSLQRSPDWPILLSNLIEERRRELPGPSATNLVIGDEVTWRSADADPAPLQLKGPGLERELVSHAAIVLDGFDRPGLFTLTRGKDRLASFAVRFQDARESDLRELSSGTRAASVGASNAPASASWIEMLLVGSAIAALLADWFLLERPAAMFSTSESASSSLTRGST